MTDADEATYANLNQVIDGWTAQLRPITRDGEDEDTNRSSSPQSFKVTKTRFSWCVSSSLKLRSNVLL